MEVASTLTEKALQDYKLVCLARDKGDRNAYSELVSKYHAPLYFMLLKMTNNPIDAEDLTIEALGKAFKNFNLYTPNYAFSTWLFRIASNNCIDYIRKQRLKTVSIDNPNVNSESEDLSFDMASEGLNPEEKIIEKQKIKLMRGIVEQLKPHYRNLVELRYFKEYSYEEIADELSLPLGTVKAQLFRARDLLYQIMKDSKGCI